MARLRETSPAHFYGTGDLLPFSDISARRLQKYQDSVPRTADSPPAAERPGLWPWSDSPRTLTTQGKRSERRLLVWDGARRRTHMRSSCNASISSATLSLRNWQHATFCPSASCAGAAGMYQSVGGKACPYHPLAPWLTAERPSAYMAVVIDVGHILVSQPRPSLTAGTWYAVAVYSVLSCTLASVPAPFLSLPIARTSSLPPSCTTVPSPGSTLHPRSARSPLTTGFFTSAIRLLFKRKVIVGV